jgi:hypothetical protein
MLEGLLARHDEGVSDLVHFLGIEEDVVLVEVLFAEVAGGCEDGSSRDSGDKLFHGKSPKRCSCLAYAKRGAYTYIIP